MYKRIVVMLITIFALAACTGAATPTPVADSVPLQNFYPPTLDPAAVSQGEQLYTQYCAACHGVNLEGQPNWQQPDIQGNFPAPPHDASGHTWHHADQQLIAITLQGGASYGGVNMPAFGDELSEADAEAILSYIKSHWGPEEREAQWRVTLSAGS